MPNDFTTIRARLDTMLADADNSTWSSAEKDELVTTSIARLWPTHNYSPDPNKATITLVPDTYYYALPANLMTISRIEWYNGDKEYGSISGQTWAVTGDSNIGGSTKLHISPFIANQGGTLRLIGNAQWTASGYNDGTTTFYMCDQAAAQVNAMARAEAYRRIVGQRQRFTAWIARNQNQNVSVNELLAMVNEAERAAKILDTENRVWQKPVPGRQG